MVFTYHEPMLWRFAAGDHTFIHNIEMETIEAAWGQ